MSVFEVSKRDLCTYCLRARRIDYQVRIDYHVRVDFRMFGSFSGSVTSRTSALESDMTCIVKFRRCLTPPETSPSQNAPKYSI